MIADKELLNKLNESGNNLLNTESTYFADTLSNFIDEVESHELSEVFYSYAAEQEKKDKKRLHELEQELRKRLTTQNNLVEEYCSTHGISLCKPHIPVYPDISEFRAYEQNLIQVSNPISTLIEAHSKSLSFLMRIKAQKNIENTLDFIKSQKKSLYSSSNSQEALQNSYSAIVQFISLNQIIYVRYGLCQTLTEQVKKYCKCNRPHEPSCFYVKSLEVLGELEYLTHNLRTSHHRSFVEHFALLDDQGQITSFKIDSLIRQRDNEKKRLDRLTPNTFWYAWDQLKGFNNVHKNFERIQQESFDSKDYLLEYSVCQLFKKIESIATGLQCEYMNELKRYVKKIISSIGTVPHQSKVLFINKGSIVIVKNGLLEKSFKTKNLSGKFVKAFCKNPYESLQDKILWAKMHNSSSPEDLDGTERKKLLETRKTVNKQLKKIGLSTAFEKTNHKKDDINPKIKIWFNLKHQLA